MGQANRLYIPNGFFFCCDFQQWLKVVLPGGIEKYEEILVVGLSNNFLELGTAIRVRFE
jgi:hypothetical protein